VSDSGFREPGALSIGMIGLDTSHAPAFTRLLHDTDHPFHVPGGRVTCAWPGGSPDFALSASRVERFTRELAAEFGVRMLESPEQVAERCDAVMLVAADGRAHLELFRRIAPYGKPVFIDKPLAVASRDAEEMLRLAERHGVPVMSCSALRFADGLTSPRAAFGSAGSPSGEANESVVAGAMGSSVVGKDGVSEAGKMGSSVVGKDGASGVRTKETAVVGADVFGPMPFQPPLPGYFWYGIHAVEMLYAILGPGCVRVSAIAVEDHDLIVGTWADGRIGTVRGNRAGSSAFGALIHRTDRIEFVEAPADLMPLYAAMLRRVLEMFRTGRPGVDAEETIEIIRFLEAANESRESGGKMIRFGAV